MEGTNKITNGFLVPIQHKIEILAEDPKDRLHKWAGEHHVPLSQQPFSASVAWDLLAHHEMGFDHEGCESEIEELLRGSVLMEYARLVVLCPGEPVFIVSSEAFVENWHSFWGASGYLQLIVLSDDGKYFMEFEDNSFLLYSNFKVR